MPWRRQRLGWTIISINGTGTNAHPTFAWETVTEVRIEDGLMLLITGNLKGLHGEFWLEPDEQIVVMRYPKPNA